MGIEVGIWIDVGYPVCLSGDEECEECRKQSICEEMGDKGDEAPVIQRTDQWNEAVVPVAVCRMFLHTAGQGAVGVEAKALWDTERKHKQQLNIYRTQ